MKKSFKIHEAKEMSNRPKSVSQKKPNRENWVGIPETANCSKHLEPNTKERPSQPKSVSQKKPNKEN